MAVQEGIIQQPKLNPAAPPTSEDCSSAQWKYVYYTMGETKAAQKKDRESPDTFQFLPYYTQPRFLTQILRSNARASIEKESLCDSET